MVGQAVHSLKGVTMQSFLQGSKQGWMVSGWADSGHLWHTHTRRTERKNISRSVISCLDSHHGHSVLDLLARVQISSVLTVSTAWFTIPHKPRHDHVQIQHSYNDTIWVTEDHEHTVGEVDVICIVSYQQRLQLIVSEWVYGKGELFWYEWQEARGYVSFNCIFLKRER